MTYLHKTKCGAINNQTTKQKKNPHNFTEKSKINIKKFKHSPIIIKMQFEDTEDQNNFSFQELTL